MASFVEKTGNDRSTTIYGKQIDRNAHPNLPRCDVLRINIFFLIIADEDDNVYTLILYSNSLFFCKEEDIAMHQ